jgi:hypothetical protein
MHGYHQGIIKVNLLLTKPSQVSKVGLREGEQQSAYPNLKYESYPYPFESKIREVFLLNFCYTVSTW